MTPAAFLNILDLLAKEVSPELQIQTLRTFLFIASRGECTQKDVEHNLNLTGGSVSRNVSYWTERRYDREKGMGFIDRVEDDYDRRLRKLTLSKEGQKFYNKLKDKL
jgi:DNA-binding MarR family transcriptional regulator